VRWRALRGREITSACIERFIDLEHLGWKGQEGTSLRSRPEDEQFFREMIGEFAAHDRAVFTELSVGDTVVASTSNLISGKRGFAFKLGWHPNYHRMAPGLLNEVEFIRNAPAVFRDIDFIDSGAAEGSFLEELWSERRAVVSGAYAATPVARAPAGDRCRAPAQTLGP
jgi:CelD/BcsL family acetyltransferase involved in cellulose biosynthesis